MRVKKPANRSFRYSTQGTVEAAARLAKLRTAKANAADERSLSKELEERRLKSLTQEEGSTEGQSLIGEGYHNRNSEVHSEALAGVSSVGVPSEDSASAEEGVEAVGSRDWASMTVHALKEELRTRGLKVSGRKAELVERLLRE